MLLLTALSSRVHQNNCSSAEACLHLFTFLLHGGRFIHMTHMTISAQVASSSLRGASTLLPMCRTRLQTYLPIQLVPDSAGMFPPCWLTFWAQSLSQALSCACLVSMCHFTGNTWQGVRTLRSPAQPMMMRSIYYTTAWSGKLGHRLHLRCTYSHIFEVC